MDIGLAEGATLLAGGHRAEVGGEFADGYFFEPTVLRGHKKMRVFQEEIFGPVLAVTTFKDEAEALEIANDTLYRLGGGVWIRDGNRAFRADPGDFGPDHVMPVLDVFLDPDGRAQARPERQEGLLEPVEEVRDYRPRARRSMLLIFPAFRWHCPGSVCGALLSSQAGRSRPA